jgi:hypothetical protein
MTQARIYRPTKTAMQSGVANTQKWILAIQSENGKFIEPVMGWCGSTNTIPQLTLEFNTKEEAIAYAEFHHITYETIDPQSSTIKAKSYSSNFTEN